MPLRAALRAWHCHRPQPSLLLTPARALRWLPCCMLAALCWMCAAPASAGKEQLVEERLLAYPYRRPDVEFVTTCHQQGWWSLFLAPSKYVEALLPSGFRLASPTPVLDWPSGYHPVLLETQVQSNCTEKSLPFIHTSFHEFKLEVPYVQRASVAVGNATQELFMFKPLLYANTWTDVLGAAAEYGLPIKHASSMPTNGTTFFAVEYDGGTFQMHFLNFSQWLPAEDAMATVQFDVFVNMTTMPWLCKIQEKCAYNTYDWGAARVRPVGAQASFGGGVLPDLGADGQTFGPIGRGQPFGSVQLDATLHVSAVTDCPY